ncbi:hypothetical protein EVAR_12430_1 [Eumeta japonica]|uniref:Uncharacterized protein n=1 Tax=Eumeta variegata TaxID=151549 RepID=A0A4C1TZN6_EUMVA|nr:hypothetical protein EVAR_12430_1 [Eumeta japonica]
MEFWSLRFNTAAKVRSGRRNMKAELMQKKCVHLRNMCRMPLKVFEERVLIYHVSVEVAAKKNWYIGINNHQELWHILADVHIQNKFQDEYTRRQFTCRLCEAADSLLLGRIGRWSGKEIARSALSLARSAQAERDNESCFFVPAAGCVRPLSLFYSDASADGVEERLLVTRSRSHAWLRRNATMSHAFSCVQPAFIDLYDVITSK